MSRPPLVVVSMLSVTTRSRSWRTGGSPTRAADQHEACLGLLPGIGMASSAVEAAGGPSVATKARLDRQLSRRRFWVMVLKGATLACGLVLVFNLAPDPYARPGAVVSGTAAGPGGGDRPTPVVSVWPGAPFGRARAWGLASEPRSWSVITHKY